MIMTMMIVAYIVLGCFLEGIGMVLITVPVFLPLIVSLGYDPIWFAVIVVIVVEVGMIDPPVGMNLFVIQAQAPEVKITDHPPRHHSVPGGAAGADHHPVHVARPGAVAAQGIVRLRSFVIRSGSLHHLVRRHEPHRLEADGSLAQTFGRCGLSRCQGRGSK